MIMDQPDTVFPRQKEKGERYHWTWGYISIGKFGFFMGKNEKNIVTYLVGLFISRVVYCSVWFRLKKLTEPNYINFVKY